MEAKDLPGRFIHAHLVSVISTGVLMWAYAILAVLTISSSVPGIIGIICSVVHSLSPLLYWRNNNYLFNSSVFIGAGIIHQMSFSYFTGGFDSNILIWLGILPMLGGVIAGRKGTVLWAVITGICILTFLILKLTGYAFPNAITDTGRVWSQGLILFGWVFISTIVIWVHVLLVELNAAELEESRQRTQNLVNILSHDISTPLAVISIKLNHLIKTPMNEEQLSATARAIRATERVVEITDSIKELRLTEMGKKEIIYSEIVIRNVITDLKEIFTERLEQKNLRLNWSVSSEVYSFHTSKNLLQNQILGNLMSNAIKYSSNESEIRIRVSKAGEFVQFVIEDSGLGIPKDMREHLFEASLSRSCPGTNGELGTGFGLPIVKGCIDRLGGSITFETKTSSEGPSGTRFKLLFPV